MSNEVIFRAVAGSLKGEEFVFDEKGLCLIGRSNDCALQIPKENDMRISRRHCLIILNPPFVSVRDLNSRNGTFVNDVRLEPGVIGDKPSQPTPVDVVLKNGDVVSLGETILEFELPTKKTAAVEKQQPPQGTKVIKLARPNKTHTGTLVPKAATVDTGFFKPPAIAKHNQNDTPPPMTELFSKPKMGLPVADKNEPDHTSTQSAHEPLVKKPIKLGVAKQGAATIAQPAAVPPLASTPTAKAPIKLGGVKKAGATIVAPTPPGSLPSSGVPPLKKPIKLGAASQGVGTIAQPVSSLSVSTVPEAKKPVSLTSPKTNSPLNLRESSTPPPSTRKPMVLGGAKAAAPIQLSKTAVIQNATVPEAPAQSSEPPPPAKKPIILNRQPKDAGAKPPLKAKIVGGRPDNVDLTEVMDVSELADDIALGAECIRKESRKKRVTKFKIKGPK